MYQNNTIKVSDTRIHYIESELENIIRALPESEEKTKLKYVLNEVSTIRNATAEEILLRFPLDVRTMAKNQEKNITYSYTGSSAVIPRSIVHDVSNMLIHLIRDSIYKINKQGSIHIDIQNVNMEIVITFETQGCEIDTNEIKKKAIKKGLVTKEEAARRQDSDMLYFLFDEKLYSNESIVAGRQMGMHFLYKSVRDLTGTISVTSDKEKKIIYKIYLPVQQH
jgi:two-component system, chemotaxis family, sensor kinase CheA